MLGEEYALWLLVAGIVGLLARATGLVLLLLSVLVQDHWLLLALKLLVVRVVQAAVFDALPLVDLRVGESGRVVPLARLLRLLAVIVIKALTLLLAVPLVHLGGELACPGLISCERFGSRAAVLVHQVLLLLLVVYGLTATYRRHIGQPGEDVHAQIRVRRLLRQFLLLALDQNIILVDFEQVRVVALEVVDLAVRLLLATLLMVDDEGAGAATLRVPLVDLLPVLILQLDLRGVLLHRVVDVLRFYSRFVLQLAFTFVILMIIVIHLLLAGLLDLLQLRQTLIRVHYRILRHIRVHVVILLQGCGASQGDLRALFHY